jgi:hypothetical protein
VRSLDIDRLWASLIGIAIALVLLAIFWVLDVRDKENTLADGNDSWMSRSAPSHASTRVWLGRVSPETTTLSPL